MPANTLNVARLADTLNVDQVKELVARFYLKEARTMFLDRAHNQDSECTLDFRAAAQDPEALCETAAQMMEDFEGDIEDWMSTLAPDVAAQE